MNKAAEQRLKAARKKFDLGYDADKSQREREQEALRMYSLDQWPTDVAKARDAQPAQGIIPATPARPCLVVDRLRQPVAQVVNQERESDLAVSLVPADDFGGLVPPMEPTEIELREGLIRRIQRESESASARTWAFLRAAICGRGYYAINTRYVDGKTFDQEVYGRRLLRQDCVVLDPAHEEPDGSDAAWGFVFTVMSEEAYKAEYPRAMDKVNTSLDADDTQWKAFMEEADGWFELDGEKRYRRVAEFWETTYTSRLLCQMPDGTVAWKDELGELPPGMEPRATRAVIDKTITWMKMDGCQILDETDWPSPYVPIIKIIGNEIPPHDNQRRVDGMVNRSAIESQRGLNYMVSKMVEEIGLSSVTPLFVEEGTTEGYEGFYNQLNTRAFATVPFKSTNLEGREARAPFRPDKSIAVAPLAQAIQMFVESIQTSTGPSDPQMGVPSRFSETWRGTQALINQSQRGTSNYMDNLARSVRYEGRIMDSLLYEIYGRRPGRMMRIVTGEAAGTQDAETVMVGQPFLMQDDGQGNERPVPAPQGMTAQMEGVRQYTLTPNAKSNIVVKVSKGFDTRRQEQAMILGEQVAKNPQEMMVMGDLFYKSQDWPGAKEAAERWEVMLDPKITAMLEQKKGGQAAIPPQALQQMQMMQQQLQQVTQQAQQMQQELQSQFQLTQMKIQGEKELAQIKADNEITLAQIKAQAAVDEAQIKAQGEQMTGLQKMESDMAVQRVAHQHDVEQSILDAELQVATQPEPSMEME